MYRWSDATHRMIVTDDGRIIPAVDGNRFYEDIKASGQQIAEASAPDLAAIKREAKATVSTQAEAARTKYLTPGSLKAMSYLKVAQEAATYVLTQGAGNYPLLAARVASGRYPDLASAAQGTVAVENASTQAAATIDEIEDRAKLQIDAATTVDQVMNASAVTFP